MMNPCKTYLTDSFKALPLIRSISLSNVPLFLVIATASSYLLKGYTYRPLCGYYYNFSRIVAKYLELLVLQLIDRVASSRYLLPICRICM